jgi:uncharacterized coiled-coil protein SlyX
MLVDRNGSKVTAPGLPDANPPLAVPARQAPTTKDAHQAILNRKVEELQATVGRQQAQIDALTAGLQKVSAELESAEASSETRRQQVDSCTRGRCSRTEIDDLGYSKEAAMLSGGGFLFHSKVVADPN